MTSVMGSPEGQGSGGTPANIMIVTAVQKGNASEKTVPESSQRPTNISEKSKPDCKPAEQNAANVNGMAGIVIVVECTMQDGQFYKSKIYFFQSAERFFMVAYTSTSQSNYDKNVGAFDGSVKTLQIANTIDAPVVPEFPVTAVGAMAAAVGIVAVLGRTRFARGGLL